MSVWLRSMMTSKDFDGFFFTEFDLICIRILMVQVKVGFTHSIVTPPGPPPMDVIAIDEISAQRSGHERSRLMLKLTPYKWLVIYAYRLNLGLFVNTYSLIID